MPIKFFKTYLIIDETIKKIDFRYKDLPYFPTNFEFLK